MADSPSQSEIFGTFPTLSARLDDLDTRVGGGSSFMDGQTGLFKFASQFWDIEAYSLSAVGDEPSWLLDYDPASPRITVEPGVYKASFLADPSVSFTGDTTDQRMIFSTFFSTVEASILTLMVEGAVDNPSLLYQLQSETVFVTTEQVDVNIYSYAFYLDGWDTSDYPYVEAPLLIQRIISGV